MTIQIDTTGPGVEDWRSAKFAATVDAAPIYVYGYEEASNQNVAGLWSSGDTPEQSWIKVNADESVTMVISLVDATPITSVAVYPPNSGATVDVSAGVATLTIPENTRLRVVVNSDRAEALHVFSAPPLTTPVSRVDYSGTHTNVSSATTPVADGEKSGFRFDEGHAFSTGDIVVLKTTGSTPRSAAGDLPEFELWHVTVLDGFNVELGTTASGSDLVLTSTGDGTLSLVPAEFEDTDNYLYFPAGVHHIGRLFKVGNSTQYYLDAGAVVVGSFDVRTIEGANITGRGTLAGTFANFVADGLEALGTTGLIEYAMFSGWTPGDLRADNVVSGITIVAAPKHVDFFGIWSWRNVHIISCWHGQADGVSTNARTADDPVSEVVDCFLFCADDAIKLTGLSSDTVSNTFAVTTYNAPYHLAYYANIADDGYTRQINNCHGMHLGGADTDGDEVYPYNGMNSIVKCWLDGWEEDSAKGSFNVTISGLRVWGDMPSRLLSIGNRIYPFASGSRDLAGQLRNWTVSDLVTENTPGQVSQIMGRDADNAPDGITFTDIRLGTVEVTSENYTTYFDVSTFARNIVWDEPDADVVLPTTFIVEDGTVVADANSYATIAFADSYFLNRGNAPEWSGATVAAKQAALRRATFYIDDIYLGYWRGRAVSSLQELSWPRSGVVDSRSGISHTSAEVPNRVKRATCEVAFRVITGVSLQPDIEAGGGGVSSSSFSVGPISFNESFSGVQGTAPRFPVVDSQLVGLLSMLPGSGLVRVTR